VFRISFRIALSAVKPGRNHTEGSEVLRGCSPEHRENAKLCASNTRRVRSAKGNVSGCGIPTGLFRDRTPDIRRNRQPSLISRDSDSAQTPVAPFSRRITPFFWHSTSGTSFRLANRIESITMSSATLQADYGPRLTRYSRKYPGTCIPAIPRGSGIGSWARTLSGISPDHTRRLESSAE